MNNQPHLSVIIPIYNAEQYLYRCIESVLSQSYTDFEILCVNDGSKDNSGEICEEYVKKDIRVRCFHKQNGGVSSARNHGIQHALGEYITFIDADDSIGRDYLLNLLPQQDEDFVIDSSDSRSTPYIDGIYCDREMIEVVLSEWQMLCPWGKLFKTSIIKGNNIKFDECGCLGEDTLFNLTYLIYVSKIRVSSKTDYKYNCTVTDSLSKSAEKYDKALHKALSVYSIGKEIAAKYDDKTIEYLISKYAGITWSIWWSLLPYPYSKRAKLIKQMFRSSEILKLMKNYLRCSESGRKYALFYLLGRAKLYRLASMIIP